MKADLVIIAYVKIFRNALAIYFTLLTAIAQAETWECPFPVAYVGVEVGHEKPFPVLIPPDVDGDKNTDPAEWNYLSNRPTDVPVTVHCYPTNNSKIAIDIILPLNVKKCRMENEHFWCE